MTLRNQFQREEIDYIGLMSSLSAYAKPRDKIRAMLRSGELIRVKKGLYVFGPQFAQAPYCKELLANWIYGPSYISLEYALSFYGLIPEKVVTITSASNKRDKHFSTPVGTFTYRYIHPSKYPIQIKRIELDEQHPILIASKEKSLVDTLVLTKDLKLINHAELESYLYDDLRIDKKLFSMLNTNKIKQLSKVYQHHHVDLLLTYLIELHQ